MEISVQFIVAHSEYERTDSRPARYAIFSWFKTSAVEWKKAKRPDCIGFKIENYAVRKKFRDQLFARARSQLCYQRPSDSRTEIFAKKATLFLNELLCLKAEYGELEISTQEFKQLLAELLQRDYLKKSQVDYYLEKIPTGITLTELEKVINKKRDAKGAIDLAISFRNRKKEYESIHWLLKAQEWSSYENVQAVIDLKKFFKDFVEISFVDLFSDTNDKLVEFLAKFSNIKSLNFSFLDQRNLADTFSSFLAMTKTVEYLDLSACMISDIGYTGLNAQQIEKIIKGLTSNRSLKELNLSNQKVDDECMKSILAALALNPNSRLSSIRLTGNLITNKGAKVIMGFLENNPSSLLLNIDLHDNRIDEKYLIEIEELISQKNNVNNLLEIPSRGTR